VATRSGRLVTLDAGGPIVVRRPTDGRVVGTLGDYRTLTGQDLTTENVGGAAVAAVDQDGERVVLALLATVPYQDPMPRRCARGRRHARCAREYGATMVLSRRWY